MDLTFKKPIVEDLSIFLFNGTFVPSLIVHFFFPLLNFHSNLLSIPQAQLLRLELTHPAKRSELREESSLVFQTVANDPPLKSRPPSQGVFLFSFSEKGPGTVAKYISA